MEKEKILSLSRKNVREIDLSMKEIIKVVEEAFKQKGKVEAPPKPGIHPIEDGFIYAISCLHTRNENSWDHTLYSYSSPNCAICWKIKWISDIEILRNMFSEVI